MDSLIGHKPKQRQGPTPITRPLSPGWGRGHKEKPLLGHLGVTSAHQGSWEVEGKMGAPRVTEALGTEWPLARDRMGDPGIKDTHPFKISEPQGSQCALSPKE